jgi:hypothetical protein
MSSLLFFVVGSALYVFCKSYPARLDPAMKTDAVFPLFISHALPLGSPGSSLPEYLPPRSEDVLLLATTHHR